MFLNNGILVSLKLIILIIHANVRIDIIDIKIDCIYIFCCLPDLVLCEIQPLLHLLLCTSRWAHHPDTCTWCALPHTKPCRSNQLSTSCMLCVIISILVAFLIEKIVFFSIFISATYRRRPGGSRHCCCSSYVSSV